ncbi:MAG: hypothetical protein V3T14_10225 [Myxococcota bacterium]
MLYTGWMGRDRFVRLAEEFAARDRDLVPRIATLWDACERLRSVAAAAVEAFAETARSRGTPHLADLVVDPVEPDEKHVDCLQVRVRRGRWEGLLLAKSKGKVTLVGPFRRGDPEKPCRDFALTGAEVEMGVEDLVEELIRRAMER